VIPGTAHKPHPIAVLLGCSGWIVYFKQSTVLPAVALALLYLTVLSLGFLMTSYLVWRAMTESTLSLFRAAGVCRPCVCVCVCVTTCVCVCVCVPQQQFVVHMYCQLQWCCHSYVTLVCGSMECVSCNSHVTHTNCHVACIFHFHMSNATDLQCAAHLYRSSCFSQA
jgi:hypothetical protein